MKLVINNLHKAFHQKQLFQNYNQVFNPSEIIGLIGENGCGKTTLIKIICGILTADKGSILYGQLSIERQRAAIMKDIGVLFDGTRHLHWRLTCWDNYLYFAGLKGCFGKALKSYGITLFTYFGIENHINARVESLSLGTKRKVSLCCALANNPSILLLDEPTNGLDEKSKQTLSQFLIERSKQGNLILTASHDRSWLSQTCSRIIPISPSYDSPT
jgi:ABC-type multidrug transport system ATPase subunit